MADPKKTPLHWLALAGASVALLLVRLVAATRVGFGDSEALYASYALHPQPAYLDHPALVGLVARLLGHGTAPSPEQAHVVTATLATLVPWGMALACRACGATWDRAAWASVVFAIVPEIAVGLFALTPDLLLALCWIGTIACAAWALQSRPGGPASTLGFSAAGVLTGVATTAKLTGALLALGLLLTYASRAARPHARSFAPWAGLAAGAVVAVPLTAYEAATGWPMLVHRLVDTQGEAGLSLRNTGALLGGQIVYLSPLVLVLVVLGAREAWASQGDAVGMLLLTTFAVPLAALLPLCLWSPVAEPHWLAPALLSLVPALARAPRAAPRRITILAGVTAGVMVVAAHAWVLVPAASRLAPEDTQADLANQLYGWPEVVRAVRDEAAAAWAPGAVRGDVAVVGPHWVVCAQLEAALRGEIAVGCDTPIRDDFDLWWPRPLWKKAEAIIWVTDARFGPPPALAAYMTARTSKVRLFRGGRAVRVFTIATMTRRAQT